MLHFLYTRLINKKQLKLSKFALLFLCVHSSAAFATDYKKGFAAYTKNEYSQAQQHWLNGAKNKDARSMFNLGLLHEQNKISGASLDKAMNWFSLSMNNGYSAAGYHMAQRMLERGGSDEQAIALIQQAADQGYAPAMRHLGIELPSVTSVATLTSTQSTTSLKAQAAPSRQSNTGQLNSEQTSSDVNWINKQLAENWTIQLLAFTQKEQVERFVIDHKLVGKAYFYTDSVNDNVFYKLLYGSYKSKIKAEFARQNLPKKLTQHGPWLRTMSSVHEVTKVSQ